jgi:hypothetical protein
MDCKGKNRLLMWAFITLALVLHSDRAWLLIGIADVVEAANPDLLQTAFAPEDEQRARFQALKGGPPRTRSIAVYAPNPRYLQDVTGRPMVLVGFGNELKNRPAVLAQLRGKINYLRAYVTWFNTEGSSSEYERGTPFPKIRDGLWDLDAWDETFWSNLRDYLDNTRDRGFIAGLTIWEGHTSLPDPTIKGKLKAFLRRSPNRDSLWNSKKNLQGIQWAYDYQALANFPNPNPHSSNARERLVYYQRRFMDRLLDEARTYPHIIFELDNETNQASEDWFLYWAHYIKERTGFLVATNWGISDISLGKTTLVDMKSYHSRSDTSINSSTLALNKVIVADADNACDNLDPLNARRIAWQAFIKGGHWNDFVCGDKTFPDAAKLDYYGKLLGFLESSNIHFWQMIPDNSILDNSIAVSGSALGKRGSEYLVYLPLGGLVTLDLSDAAGPLDVQWYNPRTGEYSSQMPTSGGRGRTFTPPFEGDAVLHLKARGSASPTATPSQLID